MKNSITVSDVIFENGEQIMVIVYMKQSEIFLNLCDSCIFRSFHVD